VKKRRKDANLSREQVAEAAHCSSSSVQGVEIGRATTLDIIEQVIGGLTRIFHHIMG
jgi:hypothetical protein